MKMDNEMEAEIRSELGEGKIVDLSSACEAIFKRGTKAFFEHYNAGEKIFTMSFDNGIVYKVKVLGMALEYTTNDPKMDVEVIGIEITGTQRGKVNAKWSDDKVVFELYNIGYKRWVRCYDLKSISSSFEVEFFEDEVAGCDASLKMVKKYRTEEEARFAMRAWNKSKPKRSSGISEVDE
jgi:hypothetical protein